MGNNLTVSSAKDMDRIKYEHTHTNTILLTMLQAIIARKTEFIKVSVVN